MYNVKSKESGFTLLEIIVVMIIVGIVAAIALPNLFTNIERSRAQEALVNMGALKQQVDACIQSNAGSSAACTTAAFPAAGTPNWAIAISGTNATGNAIITATRLGANAPAGTVVLTRDIIDSSWDCSATGAYIGVCR